MLNLKEVKTIKAINQDLFSTSSSNKAGSIKGSSKKSPKKKPLAPMLKQYLEVKESYKEHLLFFQVGDFYEVFFEDAPIVADCLQIRLTSRDKNKENPIPMCGVPIHAIDNYLSKLIENGFSVVIVSQVEAAKASKGMVKREVTRIITPGVRLDGLDDKEFNFLASVLLDNTCSVSYVDVSVGELKVVELETRDELVDYLKRIRPSEILLPSVLNSKAVDKNLEWIKDSLAVCKELGAKPVFRVFDYPNKSAISDLFQKWLADKNEINQVGELVESLTNESISSLNTIIAYVDEVSFGVKPVFSSIGKENSESSVVIDSATRRNLELTEARIDGDRRNSLFAKIDFTKTAMGSRLLKQTILNPSTEIEKINFKLDAVEELVNDKQKLESLVKYLVQVRDLDRLCSRISTHRANPKDFKMLLDSICLLPELSKELGKKAFFTELNSQLDLLPDIFQSLENSLVETPPTKINEAGIFKAGFNPEIDRLNELRQNGRKWLAQLEQEEREKTGISSIKVKYNSVFGYFFEIPKGQSSKAPDYFERKQTLTNVERFATKELKQRELEILSAKGKQIELEREEFVNLRASIANEVYRIQRTARALAKLDLICSLARLAIKRNYIRPEILDNNKTLIASGRHPVVEEVIGEHNFIPNDVNLNTEDRRLAILTGPNMGGKSTYLRQIGLIQLLAQAGSFVPAESAKIGIVDRIFTRIGAADDLSRGDSTFMVEMREAAVIVRKASKKSLVLIDEVGRGTATNDGLALASAIATWLLEKIKCRTVFATHFHQLTSDVKPGAFCLAVGVLEKSNEIVFTHRINEEVCNKSFGLEVARLAGLPEELVLNAMKLLDNLESNSSKISKPNACLNQAKELSSEVLVESELVENTLKKQISEINTNEITPMQALVHLNQIKDSIQ